MRAKAKTLGASEPKTAIERIQKYNLLLESRHLDWYEDMINLSRHIDIPVFNLSPISIFVDMWTPLDPVSVFGFPVVAWKEHEVSGRGTDRR